MVDPQQCPLCGRHVDKFGVVMHMWEHHIRATKFCPCGQHLGDLIQAMAHFYGAVEYSHGAVYPLDGIFTHMLEHIIGGPVK